MKGKINLKSRYCEAAGRNYLTLFVPAGMSGTQVERFAAQQKADMIRATQEQVNLFYDAAGVKIEKSDRLPLKMFNAKKIQ